MHFSSNLKEKKEKKKKRENMLTLNDKKHTFTTLNILLLENIAASKKMS